MNEPSDRPEENVEVTSPDPGAKSVVKEASGDSVAPEKSDAVFENVLGGANLEGHATRACNRCGLRISLHQGICGYCGSDGKPHAIEEERESYLRKWENFNPWETRIRPEGLSNFDVHYQKALTYVDRSQLMARKGADRISVKRRKAAIGELRQAIREDPTRKEAWDVLAPLLEKEGDTEGAARCYREMMLINPDDVASRMKFLKVSSHPARKPPFMGGVNAVLTFLTAWTGFWILVGLDLLAWPFALIVVLFAAMLTFLYTTMLPELGRRVISPRDGFVAFTHVPLPPERLSWLEEERRAGWLQNVIQEHTGMRVPRLGPMRFFRAILYTSIFLAGLFTIAWIERVPSIQLAGPSGALLILYFVIVQPRQINAYALLQHLREETGTLWSDFQIPFVAAGSGKDVNGEFLARNLDELPWSWAFKPYPYSTNLSGILDSIHQTLNRHWAFHRFYQLAGITHHYTVFLPSGGRLYPLLLSAAWIAVVCFSGSLVVLGSNRENRFEVNLRAGFEALAESRVHLQNEAEDAAAKYAETAREHLLTAERTFPDRAVATLYLAQLDSLVGDHEAAGERFQSAISKASREPALASAALNEYANFLQGRGFTDEAIESYRIAMRFEPDSPILMSNASRAYMEKGDFRQAVKLLSAAAELRPDDPVIYTHLGRAHEALGDRPRARRAYENALKVGEEHRISEIARSRLRRRLDPADLNPIILALQFPLGELSGG